MSVYSDNEPNKAWASHHTWYLVRPPSRPATWQIHCVSDWLRSTDANGEVAILGSTPEFQDLVAENARLKGVVIDRNQQFFEHVRYHRWRPGSRKGDVDFIHGDWTSVLQDNPGRFSAVLSDLTSGNIPYAERESFYGSVSRALVPGGLFIDRVLTLEAPLHSRKLIYDEFEQRPIDIGSINDLNCRLLFSSDLREGEELCVAAMMTRARSEWRSGAGQAYLSALSLITPASGHWWYGRPWRELREAHAPELVLIHEHPEPPGSAYEHHAKLLVKRRGGTATQVVVPHRTHISRSRAIAVLDEAKERLQYLPIPKEELGTAFLDRLVERAVAFRDACLAFQAERMEVDHRHWRFMGALFESIADRPPGRLRTYSFCWRYQRTDALFDPAWPEWKTLFCHAIELAAASRIQVRALMITEDRDAPRMIMLQRLSELLGSAFDIAFIGTTDFEATMKSDGQGQYLDFGVFGSSAAFLTTKYEPTVLGDYIWAVERVVGLHDLFDRIWDQAVKPAASTAHSVSIGTARAALTDLVILDRETPVSCLADLVDLGGGLIKLSERDYTSALQACADAHNRAELDLRRHVASAIAKSPRRASLESMLRKCAAGSTRGSTGSKRPSTPQDGHVQSVSQVLQSMYFLQTCDFVLGSWSQLSPPGNKAEIRELVLRINSRPHAHAKPIDLADFALHRQAVMRFSKWLQDWESVIGRVDRPGGDA